MSSINLTHYKKMTQLLKTPPALFRLNVPLKMSCLDPRKGGDRDGKTLLKLLFEGLTRFGKDGKVALALAKSCTVSEDQTCYRITLKRTYWSNGDPVIASDFEYAWKTALAPDFPIDFPALFYVIKHAEQAKRGKYLLDDVGIIAKNPRTLLITLNHPIPDFLKRLVHPLFLPIPSNLAKNNLNWVDRPVFNGPFCLQELEEGVYFYLRKNTRYFRKKWVKINHVLIAPGPSEETVCSLKKSSIDTLGKQLFFAPNTLYFSFNTSLFPTCSASFRKALIAATDQKQLKALFPKGEESGPAPLHFMQSTDHYSPRKACALFEHALEAELHLEKEQIPPLFLIVPNNTLYYAIAKNLENQWEAVLNIRCMIQSYSVSEFHQRRSEKTYHLTPSEWEAPTSDPLTTLIAFKSATDPFNFSHFENLHYQKLLNLAAHEIDPLKRETRIKELENILISSACILPLF